MAEYERSRLVLASPEDVFAFVADVGNLPTFLPTVERAETPAEGRVRVRGEVRGRADDDDGWLRIDANRRRMEWGADERDYPGWMIVTGEAAGAQVVVHLSLAPFVDDSGRPRTGESAVEPDPIEEGLEAALDSLRNLLEGRGGKEEPAVTT